MQELYFKVYLFRLFESFWFVFVTQMSHLPMEIKEDENWDWVTSNTITTTNVTPGIFSDWFTGHFKLSDRTSVSNNYEPKKFQKLKLKRTNNNA